MVTVFIGTMYTYSSFVPYSVLVELTSTVFSANLNFTMYLLDKIVLFTV